MRRHGNQEGHVVVTVAVLLTLLLFFAALAIDVGALYSARAAAQRAADAGALAGAFTFVVDDGTQTTAETHARQVVLNTFNNKILGSPIADSEVTVTANADPTVLRVTVQITHNQGTFFARVLGENAATISVTAIAEASTNATASNCVKPWFIPNTIVSSVDPCGACAANQVLVTSAGELTPFGKAQIGTQITIKSQDNSQRLAPGQFFAIQLNNDTDTGGKDYKNNIALCASGAVYCNTSYNTKSGNMVGPTTQGVTDLIGDPPDTWVSLYHYHHPTTNTTTDTSRSLAVAPIWDVCGFTGFCPGNQFPSGGNTYVTVVGFALIFLDGVKGGDVQAHIVNVAGCAAPNGGPSLPPTASGAYSIPLRLVRLPEQ